MKVGSALILEFKDGFGISAWVHPTGAGSEEGGIIVNREEEYELGRSSSGKLQFALANDDPGWNWVETDFELTLKTWTHVAWTYSAKAKVLKLYANGKEVHSAAADGALSDNYPEQDELWIGGRQKEGGAEFFEGRIGDVRIYNRALTADEVRALHSVGAPKQP